MKQWQAWSIALTSALLGAALGRFAVPRDDADVQPSAAELAGAVQPNDEPPRAARAELAAALQPIEPKPRTTSAALGRPTGHNPLSMLSLEQRKTLLRHKYGGLIRELELSPSDADRLLQVLYEQEQRDLERARSDRAGRPRGNEAERDRVRTELSTAIGSSKAAAFERLRDTLPARFELRRLRDQLEEAGEPMTTEQQRALADIIGAEGPGAPPSAREGESLEESAMRYRAWASERDRSVRENAATILNPAQLKTLDDSERIRDAMRPALGSVSRRTSAQAGSGG